MEYYTSIDLKSIFVRQSEDLFSNSFGEEEEERIQQ